MAGLLGATNVLKNRLLACRFSSGNPVVCFDTWIVVIRFPLVLYFAVRAKPAPCASRLWEAVQSLRALSQQCPGTTGHHPDKHEGKESGSHWNGISARRSKGGRKIP